jgi:hypothetical protein
MRMQKRQAVPTRETRWGTATVEMAVTLPIFMTIVLGIAEMSRALDASERLSSAIRQGGRFAASDMNGTIPKGWTANQKVISDIKSMLTAGGMDGSKVDISITYADGTGVGKNFDLEDPDNYLQYFKITAQVKYSDVGLFSRIMANQSLAASVVFRLGRSSLAT